MSEELKFHPEIENAIETSGDDIGRVKDDELAHEVALSTNHSIDYNSPLRWSKRFNDHDKERQSEAVKYEIAKRAVTRKFDEKATDLLVSNAIYGTVGGSGYVNLMGGKKELDIPKLQEEAKIVNQEYDMLERMAKRAQDAKEKQ